MHNLDMIRNLQLDLLRRSQLSVHHILHNTAVADLSSYRDGGSGWTVTEVLCHLRDFEALFLHRAQLTTSQDFPDLPFPDPDELARQNNYAGENPLTVFDAWQATRRDLLAFFATCPAEAWERTANHPTRGPFSLHQQLFLTAWHDVNHIEQITRILQEKLVAPV